ncbi:hypothetical protein T4E_5139 [Trichinella pseudospiralis]|uniref:PiggyBac transposable element-derived protein domain-containing protein n=1 Tax=Trichinella pseudospiralis TaxID=6337 RepID=A0A0V0YHK6_TRIPS|nr:hypothetical protein T4E_5139 [Trichinella pseudospiralis]
MYGSFFWTRVVSSNDLPTISADSSHVFFAKTDLSEEIFEIENDSEEPRSEYGADSDFDSSNDDLVHFHKSNFNTAEDDMKIFIDLLMKMGILALQPFRFDAIANKITRNGFADILRFLYFNDNKHAMLDRRHLSCDQFYKVLPILEMTRMMKSLSVSSFANAENEASRCMPGAVCQGCRMTFFYDRQQIEVEISSDFAPADVNYFTLTELHVMSGLEDVSDGTR